MRRGLLIGVALVAGAVMSAAGDETPRPVLHFTPEKNWTNDPNGLIWLDGEYHLFYQYNPFGDQWGHMSWGHAVSKDLFAWEHLPVAIPEAGPVMAFSGTAVLDRMNTAGFGKAGEQVMVAVYTGHEGGARRQYQNLAYSTDRGRTFKVHGGNPVLDLGVAEFRDPKVFWHEATTRWVMVVALSPERKALFYSSPDLKSWTKMSEFGREPTQGRTDIPNWECPDLFQLPIEGEKGEARWVLVVSAGGNGPHGGSGVQYFVGDFDGTRFVNENKPETVLWVDHGKDFYAFQSYNDEPRGRRIGLAWMANTHYAGATPTSPWRGAMTVPREYTLARTAEGVRLRSRPIEGIGAFIDSRGGAAREMGGFDVVEGVTPTPIIASAGVIEAVFEIGGATRFGLRVREGEGQFTAVGYDVAKGEMYVDRRKSGRVDIHPDFGGVHAAPVAIGSDKRVTLTIVVDTVSVEAFGEGGAASITSLVFPDARSRGVSVFAEGGGVKLKTLRATGVDTPR